MLNRQRILLYLTLKTGGCVGHLQLTKLAFLVAREAPERGGTAFYDFVPYHYGPFSFTMFQEIARMTARRFFNTPSENTWALTATGRRAAASLPDNLRSDAEVIAQQFASMNASELLDYVYEQYPWFGLNLKAKQKRRVTRRIGEIGIHTIGYEGWTVDSLLNYLLTAGIQRVVDVRCNPVSRRYGFHGSTLNRLCNNVNIEYFHVPELGISSDDRNGLDVSIDRNDLLDRYEAKLKPSADCEPLNMVCELLRSAPSVLLCQEADPHRCHRGRLAKILKRRLGLEMIHQGWPRNQ